MNGSLVGLLAVNALYLALGAGLLPLLRLAPTRTALRERLPLAYALGLAVAGVASAHLALVDVPLGLPELAVVAAVVLALGVRRARRLPPGERAPAEPATSLAIGWLGLAAALVLLLVAARAYAVRPLVEWDGWAIWGLKAKALYEFGGTGGPVFTTYPPLQHPLYLPSLEAIGFRAMGAFDGTLVHVQLILLAFAFAGGLWGLLRPRVPAAAVGITLLVLFSASAVLKQLSTNLADIPLAFLVALAVAALARFVDSGESWTLVPGGLFLGAAMLTKSEGTLFAAAAALALLGSLALSDRSRLPRAALAVGAAFALLAPWRLFLASHDLRNPEYSFSSLLHPGYLADRSERVRPAASALWHQLWSAGWGLLAPLVVLAFAAALVSGRGRLAAFVGAWLALSFAGLVLVYWISIVPIQLTLAWTAERTVTSLLVGGGALVPLLAAGLVGEALERGERRLLDASRREEPRLPAEG